MSSFGLKDRCTQNLDIRLLLWEGKYVDVFVNGQKEKRFRGQSKEQLAAKPVKYLTRFGRYLSIGFDKLAGHLSMKHQGIDAENLPLVKPSLQIC